VTKQGAPKVSVCIPTYNYGRFIGDAIESVLAQTFDDFELVVVDNCSTDDTREIVERYAARDVRIVYYINDTNLGMVGNWNRCLELARGMYVKILCADDVLLPECLERSVRALDEFPGAALVSGARLVVDRQLNALKTYSYSDCYECVPGTQLIKRCLFSWNVIGEPTAVLFRKNLSARGFNKSYMQQADVEMWFHLLEQGDFVYVPELFCKFRHHEEQTSAHNEKLLISIDDLFLIYRDYVNKKYIDAGFVEKQKLRFLNVYYLWTLKSKGIDKTVITDKISSNYNLLLFYVLMIIKTIIDKLKYNIRTNSRKRP